MKVLFFLIIILVSILSLSAEEHGYDLIQETLVQDIDTAGYYELLSWCRELDLEDSGGRKDLQQRLYRYFEIDSSSMTQEVPEKRLEIKSARVTEYFTMEEIDEQYILLQGDVLVELLEGDTVHEISAQRILLNQTENILTAVGDIDYILRRGEQEDRFKGERLTFNIDSWEGVFFQGLMESERDIGTDTIRFSFLADSITKLENDTIVMRSGRITSSEDLSRPNYQIKAKKIWVLAPGEWAIRNAVLYVGHIPVMYIPFFFYPGDEFFFHPVIDSRDREGNLLQTTTYLLGKKTKKKSALSFLAATEADESDKKLKLDGLFLREADEPSASADSKNWNLKILFDLYSRLGGFAGVEGDFPSALSFQGGIAVSRSLFTEEELYTPVWLENGVYRSFWNRSWLFGIEMPFRYGLSSEWSLDQSGYRFFGRFKYYSDPFFTSDFYDRSEDINWAGVIGLDTAGETTSATTKNLSWELKGRADFSKLIPGTLLSTLSIPFFNLELYWQSRESAGSDSDPIFAANPSREFYYPVTMKIPSTSLQMAGVLLSLPRGAAAAEPGPKLAMPETPGRGYRPLSNTVNSDTAPGATASNEPSPAADLPLSRNVRNLRVPEPKVDLPVFTEIDPVAFKLSYQLRPNFILEQSFDTEDMTGPADVVYDVNYTTLDTSGTSSLDYSLNIQENQLNFTGGLAYTGSYRTRIDQGFDDSETWQQLVENDYEYNKFDFNITPKLSYYPFRESDLFKASVISYDINWVFYQYLLDESESVGGQPVYHGVGPTWDEDTVRSHNLATKLSYKPLTREHSAALSVQLPPNDWLLSADLLFYVWLLKTTVNTSIAKTADTADTEKVWAFQPLLLRETLALNERITFSEELRFNLVQRYLEKSISSLSLWGFTASFTAERTEPLTFDSDTGWSVPIDTAERFL
ncbi:MAG TPA: LPS-assembly protein LptD, partial [bacterium]|nr:LPS-assembly protein LptD [bacterium]